jgi:predicted enzyme related to lactoylglutathione lyase
MSLHNRIDYFELPANDLVAARRFYSGAFDWTFNDYGPSYAGFAYATADREAGGIASDSGHIRAPLAILYSDHLELSEERVRSAGGKIVKSIFSFPGGRRFRFTDPCGNELAVWSDK